MATWNEFTAAAPELAAAAEHRWPGIVALERGELGPQPIFEVAYLATIRPDGRPRLHPFCPVLADGRMFAAIPPKSPKGHDLRRDPRCAIHALPGPEDDELLLLAQATEVADDATRSTVCAVVERSDVTGMIATVSEHPLFEFDIEQVDVARWVNIGQRGTYAERLRWRADA
jgi:pyridoxamine 5'-phosphate oxidase-like protein